MKAILVGASSGIGRALAVELDRRGWTLGLSARRKPLLEGLAHELRQSAQLKVMDVMDPASSLSALRELSDCLGGYDLLVLNAGVGSFSESDQGAQAGQKTLQTNALGIAALMEEGVRYFCEMGTNGHLVVISSISALQASPWAPAYSASKACVSNYLKGLRVRHAGKGLFFTDIRPGFVETDMIRDVKRKFFTITPKQAAKDIADAIFSRKKTAYVPARWFWLGLLYRFLPEGALRWIYRKSLED